jgi:hypothetical protein
VRAVTAAQSNGIAVAAGGNVAVRAAGGAVDVWTARTGAAGPPQRASTTPSAKLATDLESCVRTACRSTPEDWTMSVGAS